MFGAFDRTRRVLVIDDNSAIHEDFRKVLEGDRGSADLDDATAAFFGEQPAAVQRPQYDVTSALQGQEGFAILARAIEVSQPFDVAFVDMRMPPGWDGPETIENLWTLDPQLQVVICTAYSDYTWNGLVDRLGQRDNLLILKKPFDTAEVLQLSAALSEKRHLARQAAARLEDLEKIVNVRTHALQEAHHESESLLAAIASLLIGLDAHGVVRRWNTSAETMFRITAEDAINTRFEDLPIDWKDSHQVHHYIRSRPAIGRNQIEVELRDHDGSSRVLALSSFYVTNGIHHEGLLLLGTEITEQRLLQLQLQQAQKLESIGQLAAGVAHEINTPMQYVGDNIDYLKTVVGYLQPFIEDCNQLISRAKACDFEIELTESLIRQSERVRIASLTTEVSEALNDSAEGVQHVSRIIQAMKEFSHPGLVDRSTVDLNHALETTISVARHEWKYVAEMETHFADDLEFVPGFPSELNQVFLNLIVNAAQAIGERRRDVDEIFGIIRVSTSRRDSCVRIEISDNGGGIPKQIRSRVFDPFFTTKEVGKGTGQGLAIAHSVIVQMHGGRIWFEVQENVGTTFFIELPAGDGPNHQQFDVQKIAILHAGDPT